MNGTFLYRQVSMATVGGIECLYFRLLPRGYVSK